MSEGVTIQPSLNADKSLRSARNLSWLAAELTVVVIGVVLGIAFSAWWQSVQDQEDIRASLERLSDNLQMTLVDLQADVEIIEQSWEAAQILINTDASERTRESSASALQQLFDTRTPVPESAEYRALTSTGKLRDISNSNIIMAVTAVYEQMPYLTLLADLTSSAESDLRKMVDMGLVYQNLGDFDGRHVPEFTLNEHGDELLARADVRAQIIHLAYFSSYQGLRYHLVISEIENAIASIEEELR